MAGRWKMLTPERLAAYRAGAIVAVICGVMLLLPGRERWHAAGPANVGHARIECGECHIPAPGSSVGQALQNIAHVVGLADSSTDFVFAPAGKEQCLACHETPTIGIRWPSF